MYHIVKDVASLITMPSKKQHLTALTQRLSHFQTRRVNTSKLGRLTCFTSVRDISHQNTKYNQENKEIIMIRVILLIAIGLDINKPESGLI